MDNFNYKKYLGEGRIHLKEGKFGNVIQSLTQDISKAQDEGDSKMVSILKSYLPKLKTSEGDAEIESTLNALDTELAREFGESFDIVGSYLAEGKLHLNENIEQYIDSEDDISDIRGGKTIAINFNRRMYRIEPFESAVINYAYDKYGDNIELDWRDGQEVEIHIGNASNDPSPSNNLGVSDLNKYVAWKKKNFSSIHSPVSSPLREGKELDVVETDNRDSTYTILRLSNGDYVEVNVIELYQNLIDNQDNDE